MIMQNPGGGDQFFSDVLNSPSTSVLDQTNAPIADWRFLPGLIGRPQRRMDTAHRTADRKPQILRDNVSADALSGSAGDTLYFG
jgi:hypothetical protein